MKKRTSKVSRRIVSLLMSMVLTLTLVTPAAFATEVVGGSGTAIIEGNANPADVNPNEDTEGKDDVDKSAEDEQQPAEPDDENAEPSEGEDAVNEPSNEADTQEGEGTDTPVVAQRTVTVERYRTDAAYEVKIVVGVEEDGTTEKLDTTYAIDADTKTVTLKLTTADYDGEPVYIKTALDDVLVTEGENQTPALTKDASTLEYTLPEEGDVTLYYGTQEDFVSAWYTSVTDDKYTIRTAEELAYLSALTNGTAKDCHGDSVDPDAFENKFVSLIRDIDLSAYPDWIPIGYGYYDFEGTLDGENHTVTVNMDKRFSDESESDITVGIIGWLNGIVKNLSVAGSITVVNETSNTAYVGAIVGTFGNSAATISQCKNAATIDVDVTVSNANVGGIVGASRQKKYNSNVQGVVNCLNEGNITIHAAADLTVNVAGIMGTGKVGNPISSCWNTGDVAVTVAESANVTSIGGNVAGIAGNNSNITSCANYGRISTPSDFVGNTAGIIGVVYKNKNGLVTNSYNVGDITGNENGLFGIGKVGSGKNQGKIENSYYVCKLNGAEKMAYINNASEAEVKYNEMDKTYTVGDDTTLLVKTLNDNRGSNIAWFVNHAAGVYFPIHVLSWTGDRSEEFGGVTINITYDPNGGMAAGGSAASVTVTETLEPDITTGEWTAVSHTVLAVDSEELGFVNENGEIKETPWNTVKDGTGTGYNAGDSICISDPKSEGITLYAQWDNIWAGTGTEADPYQIADADKLTALATQVNGKGFDYTGKWFKLMKDIALTGEWTPIGNSKTAFDGNLDGNQKSISGLNVNTSTQYAGLFGAVGKITVQSLILQGGSVTCTNGASSWCGGLAGRSASLLLSDVHIVNMAISGDGLGGTGGILGGGNASMTACSNTGGSVLGRYAGGLTGKGTTESSFTFLDCSNSADVAGRLYAGGMTGCDKGASAKFTNCSNAGSISGGERANGIAAMGDSFIACINAGTVNSSGGQANGITGEAMDITQCGNTGTVNGGIAAGIARHAMRVEKCYNTGKIAATAGNAAAYGIAGSVRWYIKNSFTYNVDTQVPLVSNIKGGTYGDKNEVTNSYYLASSATAVNSAGEYATLADFASGKVAWGVDGGVNAHKNYWTQGANNYPVPIGEGTSTSYYRAKAECGTGGAVSIKSSRNFTGDADNAVYGPKGMSVTVTATPKDDTFGLKSLTLDLMSTGTTSDLANPGSFALGAANAKVVATFASAGSGGGSGSGSGSGSGAGTGDENDEGLQDGMNMDVEYNVKGLVLSAYTEWGSNGGGKTFSKWLKDSPNVLRALISNSLDNMAAAAAAKKTDEASALAQALLASLNEHSGVAGKDGDAISKALQRFMTSGTEATFSTWLTTGSGMASGTVESIFTQYTDSLLALADRLYAKWESSGTSMTFPAWLDAQQVSMENLSETAEEPDTDTTDESQTTEAPEDVPDGQESEGQVSGNSIWEIIGTAVRENPIIVWSIVAVVAALVIVGAVRRYHKVKRDERDDNGAE